MAGHTVQKTGSIQVVDYRCERGPDAAPALECHDRTSLAYVRAGTFGYRPGRMTCEMVAGSTLVGRAGDDYVCTHDHLCGDECLAFMLSPEAVETLGGPKGAWESRGVPPVRELAVAGELAQAAASGRGDMDAEEAGLLYAATFLRCVTGEAAPAVRPDPRVRHRVVRAALWLEANAREEVSLTDVAREAGLSPFHALRVFSAVLGVTPHQYLVQSRLRRAARLLAREDAAISDIAYDVGFGDLSNFNRTFRRAAGVSPRGFRRLARGDRKILQERLEAGRVA